MWCVWTSALRGWGQSVWWVAFGFVRRAPRLQRLAIGVTVRWRDLGMDVFPTMPQGSEAHPSAIRGNLYEPRSRYTTCDAVVLPEEALRRCEDHGKPSCMRLAFVKLVLENPKIQFNPGKSARHRALLPSRNSAMRAARRRGNRGTRRIYGQRPSSNGAQSSSTPGLASNKYVSKHCCRVTTAEPNPSLLIMAHAR